MANQPRNAAAHGQPATQCRRAWPTSHAMPPRLANQPCNATARLGWQDADMDPCVHFITLGVPDVDAARAFYVDGLGWPSAFDVPGEITFIQVGHGLLLGLFGAEDLATDIGQSEPYPSGPAPFTLAQVVETEEQVRAVLDAAVAAGGQVLKAAQHAEFGGYHGYFADPSGFRWEVATNPGWSVAPDGKVSIGPINP
jgi:catechol 2,3-dioxygenase-like lactoylglutathione lyase family enzyme